MGPHETYTEPTIESDSAVQNSQSKLPSPYRTHLDPTPPAALFPTLPSSRGPNTYHVDAFKSLTMGLFRPRRHFYNTIGVFVIIGLLLSLQNGRGKGDNVDSPMRTETLGFDNGTSAFIGKSPEIWLRKNSGDIHAIGRSTITDWSRPKAAMISLVRNEELEGIIQSMSELELHWNHKYRYPWIFFNDKAFDEEFKATTSNLTNAKCYYEVVPLEHWSAPEWLDVNLFVDSLEYLGIIGVGKGWMPSYRNMCRWNSGFFYKHARLLDFEYYWRVEPDCHFFCDIDYDVFRFMRDNKMKYGFNMNILDDARSFASLWSRTRSFIDRYPHLLHPQADLDWLLDPHHGGDYNNCQFFSNFEIGDLSFFRGHENEMYFDWLDKSGGFFYERFGDAPIHTLSVAMFLPKHQIHFFRDIGYQHDINRNCPPSSAHRCSCEPTGLDENFYKLVPLESPQKKPPDTCIRQFLGGKWLEKKEGWNQETERVLGGDGFHGYVYDDMGSVQRI